MWLLSFFLLTLCLTYGSCPSLGTCTNGTSTGGLSARSSVWARVWVAGITGSYNTWPMLNVHHENEHWLKIQEMFESLKTLTSSTYWMICCIICCYIHIRRGTFCMNHQLCMAADHCSSRFINRIVFLIFKI